ncbi:MAG: LCP family protein [Rhodoluna sp.]|nr:LCP family protein [Rhodoluna sp.]
MSSRRVIRPPTDPKKFPPRHGNQKPTAPGRKYVRWAFKGLALVAGAALAAAGISAIDIYNRLNQDNIILSGGEVDLEDSINFLLIGSDTRAGQGEEYGEGEVTSELADVIILLHITKDRNNATVVSFPRDLLVSVPECPNPNGGVFPAIERQQINGTIARGGVACTHLTIQKLTGLEIPFLAVIDFNGVIEMTNAVGGVEVVIDQPISDDYSKFYIDAGTHTLKGKEALGYLRTRHGVGDGSDIGRISNQQLFLMSLFEKVRQDGVLNNPVALYSLASAAARNMKLSESITDLDTMITLARALRQVDSSKMVFTTVPTVPIGGADQGRLVLIPDQANELFDKIKLDQPVVIATKSNP